MKTRILISILSAGALCLGQSSNAQGAKPQFNDDEVERGDNKAMKKLDAADDDDKQKGPHHGGQHPGAGHKPKDKAHQMADNKPADQPNTKAKHDKGQGGGVAGGIANNGGKALPPGLAMKAARGEMLPPPWRTGVFLPPGLAKKQGGGLPPGIAMNVANGKPMPPGLAKKFGGGAHGFGGKKHDKEHKSKDEDKEND